MGDRPLEWLRPPCVMGVVNVTPDSFSDGGAHLATTAARLTIDRMAHDGAAIVDIGAESTRPGAERVDASEQLRRLAPLFDDLANRPPEVALSIDSTRSVVAAAAIDAGAVLVNDVSAGRDDDEMFSLVAERGVAICVMHMRGQPRDMQIDPRYEDVVAEVCDFLSARVDAAMAAGIPRAHILVDPGIGFGKTLAHNLSLLSRMQDVVGLGQAVVVGVSRKGVIGLVTGRPVEGRAAGSIGGALAAIAGGAHVVRVHDVQDTVDAVQVWNAISGGQGE